MGRQSITIQEKSDLLKRYKNDTLFKQWLPTLHILPHTKGGGKVKIWHEAECALQRLKLETNWGEVELQLIYTELYERYPTLPVFCLNVMAVLIARLIEINHKEKQPPEKTSSERDSTNVLEQMVENALVRDDTYMLNVLKLRLYELENPSITRPLIARINKRITSLKNVFHYTEHFPRRSKVNQPEYSVRTDAQHGKIGIKHKKRAIMNNKNNKQRTTINHINGFQFNGCQITNLTFQTAASPTEHQESDITFMKGPEPTENNTIPKPLCTDEAQCILNRMCSAGILDEYWQPVGLSNTEKGVLASLLANQLGICNLWKTFGFLWRINPETLRIACNKGMGQKRTEKFMERVKGSFMNV